MLNLDMFNEKGERTDIIDSDYLEWRATDHGKRVFMLFCKYALEAWKAGKKRYSARAIIELIRWHESVKMGKDGFKINNNATRPLAMEFEANHNDCEGFFSFREHGE